MSFGVQEKRATGTGGGLTPPLGTTAFATYIAVATPGQTVFPLVSSYLLGGLAFLWINGVEYLKDTDYTISGTTLTWLDVPFVLSAGDVLKAVYEKP